MDRDGGADKVLDSMPSRWGLSSDVWRALCLPPPSEGGRDERRDQNDVARRVTSTNMEVVVEVDPRAAFQRCRSAISQRLRFYGEQGKGQEPSGSKRAPPAPVGFPPPRR